MILYNTIFSSISAVIPQSSLWFSAHFNPRVSDRGFSRIPGDLQLSFISEPLTCWLEALWPQSRLVRWSNRYYVFNWEIPNYSLFLLGRICQSPSWGFKLDYQHFLCLVEERGWQCCSLRHIHLVSCFQLYMMSPTSSTGWTFSVYLQSFSLLLGWRRDRHLVVWRKGSGFRLNWLHNLQDPVQNYNVNPLAQNLLRTFMMATGEHWTVWEPPKYGTLCKHTGYMPGSHPWM